MSAWFLILSALAGLGGAFAVLYLACRRLDNYGFVDVAWSYAFLLLAGFYAVGGTGWGPRRLLVATLAGIWSLRLGTHLLKRVAGHHPVEDGRYVQLRRDWAGNFGPKMFGFFQMQAASVVLLGVPFLLPVLNPTADFHALEIAGVALWVLAIAGEAVAERNSPPSNALRPTGAASAPWVSGATAGTPIIFSSGWSGSRISSSRSPRPGAGWR